MALGTGLCAGKIVAGVLGIGAASVLGFNWITTGCPTGVCPTERAAMAAIVPASMSTGADKADSCCELMAVATESVAAETASCETACETACDSKSAPSVEAVAEQVAASCCSEKAAEAVMTNVAMTTEAAASCCFDKGAEAPCDEAKACCQENFGLADTSAAKP